MEKANGRKGWPPENSTPAAYMIGYAYFREVRYRLKYPQKKYGKWELGRRAGMPSKEVCLDSPLRRASHSLALII